MNLLKPTVTTLFMASTLGFANAAQIIPGTGILSDLCYNKEGGDLLGMEIHITESHGLYNAAVQVAEGEPSTLVTVPVAVIGNQVTFTVVAGPDETGRYAGRVTRAGFVGTCTVTTPGQTVINRLRLLRKKKSYWKARN
ncbi:MAG TPA: hypothetical protein VGI20_13255 [Rhizomicrobium sp.]|jgi:hypothetical protein